MAQSPAPSRRALITGRVLGEAAEAHISSLVVHARPERLEAVRAALTSVPGVEIPGGSGGKLIVTLETDTEGEIVERLNEIAVLDGVLSAALVFHHCEPAEPVTAAGPISSQDLG